MHTERFGDAVRDFYGRVPNVRLVKERGEDPKEAVRVLENLEAARTDVRETLRALERLVSQDLESL